jgi:hypothetical protein
MCWNLVNVRIPDGAFVTLQPIEKLPAFQLIDLFQKY